MHLSASASERYLAAYAPIPYMLAYQKHQEFVSQCSSVLWKWKFILL